MSKQQTVADALSWVTVAQDSISDLIRDAMDQDHPLIDDAREVLLALNETFVEVEHQLDDELDELAEED